MTDRPILFSGPMVRALLNGSKTQTRRISKKQDWDAGILARFPRQKTGVPFAPGGRLWCRETFRGARGYDNVWPRDFGNKPIWYEADGVPPDDDLHAFISDLKRPSTQMPREFSRITLLVDDVRVQRVQDISYDDLIGEGIKPAPGGWSSGAEGQAAPTVKGAFALLWDSTQTKPECRWYANPWVVALTFRVVKQNIDSLDQHG